MALRSPTLHHSFWGNGFADYAALPNVSAADTTVLEEGDTAYISATELLYVCVDPTPGAAVWTAQAPGNESRIIHTPGITPSRPTAIPGQEPAFITFGTPTPWLIGLHFDNPQQDQ